MKEVVVTLTLRVTDDASIEEVVGDIQANVYGCIEEVISVEASETEREFKQSEDDPSDVCML